MNSGFSQAQDAHQLVTHTEWEVPCTARQNKEYFIIIFSIADIPIQSILKLKICVFFLPWPYTTVFAVTFLPWVQGETGGAVVAVLEHVAQLLIGRSSKLSMQLAGSAYANIEV